MKRSIWRLLIAGCLLLLAGCRCLSDSPNPLREGAYRAETRAWQDSTYHYVRDSVVVYVGATSPTPPKEGLSEYLQAPSLRGLGESHWHTEYRNRVVTKTDTVYQDREVEIQLPPERYVPRAVKGLAWAGGAAIFSICLWLILKMCKFVNWKICK